MPTVPFFLVAAALGGYGWYKRNADIEEVKQEEIKKVEEQTTQAVAKKRKKATRESVMELLNIETLEIEIGYRLVSLLDVQRGGDLLERIGQIRRQTAIDFGIVLPSIRVRDNLQLAPNTYQVKLKGVALESGDVYPDRSLAMNSMGGEDNPNIIGIKAIEPAFHLPAIWIEEKDKEYAEMVGYTVVSASAVISTHLTELIRKNAADILTRHDIAQLIENLKKEVSEDYVNDLMKDVATSDVQQVIQNLLREKVSVRDLRTILETISLEIKKNRNPNYLTEQCRLALARNIANQNLSDTGELLAITLSQEVEQVIAQGVNPDGESLTLDPDFVKQLMDSLNFEFEKAIQQTGSQPVILCSSPIRMIFRKLIERTYPQIAIMSYNEVTNNIKARSIGTIKVNMNSII